MAWLFLFEEADKKDLLRRGWGLWFLLAAAAVVVFVALALWVFGMRRRRMAKVRRRGKGMRLDPWEESARRVELTTEPGVPRERPAPGTPPATPPPEFPPEPPPGDDPVPGDE